MPILNRANLDVLFISVQKAWQAAYEAAQTTWQDYASLVPSGTTEERYAWVGLIPGLEEWVGPRTYANLKARSMAVVNRKFQQAIALRVEDFEDDRYGVFSSMTVPELGRVSRAWPDRLMADTVKAATTALAFDGQAFFHASHPVDIDNAAAGTYSNRFDSTTSGALPLTGAHLGEVIAAMMSVKGEDGRELGVRPTHIMVGPSLIQTTKELCTLEYIAELIGATYPAMKQNAWKGFLTPIVNPLLSANPGRWILMDCSRAVRPFVFQQRQAPVLTSMVSPSDPNVFELDELRWGVRARGEGTYSLPFLAAMADSA